MFVLLIWILWEQFYKLEVWIIQKCWESHRKTTRLARSRHKIISRPTWMFRQKKHICKPRCFNKIFPDFEKIVFVVWFGQISVHFVHGLRLKIKPKLSNMIVNLSIRTQKNFRNAVSVKIWIHERQTAALVHDKLFSGVTQVAHLFHKETQLKDIQPLQRPPFWSPPVKMNLDEFKSLRKK